MIKTSGHQAPSNFSEMVNHPFKVQKYSTHEQSVTRTRVSDCTHEQSDTRTRVFWCILMTDENNLDVEKMDNLLTDAMQVID